MNSENSSQLRAVFYFLPQFPLDFFSFFSILLPMQNLTPIISTHISSLYGDISFSPTLSAPPKPEHGEYCFGVFTLAKPLGKAPNIIAEEIATTLGSDTDNFTQVNVIGGYVNFSCAPRVWLDILNTISNSEMVKPGK